MPRINLQTLDQEAVESRELRERRRISEHRNQRRTLHRTPKATFVCPDCGGDCESIMLAIQASMKGGRQ